ncbi:hypothetical protein C442_20866 [Haloarcula amylolytica JCM 13557]|uniref:Uncharacterized protein n=1 Tax=Haloarcula amylolytica JCM 13557 TaxID=1227452 RepID=M0K0F9_9EURY|nr:hypothetical protein C442_20866 [Haloarcula amylolytica JCM 13557]
MCAVFQEKSKFDNTGFTWFYWFERFAVSFSIEDCPNRCSGSLAHIPDNHPQAIVADLFVLSPRDDFLKLKRSAQFEWNFSFDTIPTEIECVLAPGQWLVVIISFC